MVFSSGDLRLYEYFSMQSDLAVFVHPGHMCINILLSQELEVG